MCAGREVRLDAPHACYAPSARPASRPPRQTDGKPRSAPPSSDARLRTSRCARADSNSRPATGTAEGKGGRPALPVCTCKWTIATVGTKDREPQVGLTDQIQVAQRTNLRLVEVLQEAEHGLRRTVEFLRRLRVLIPATSHTSSEFGNVTRTPAMQAETFARLPATREISRWMPLLRPKTVGYLGWAIGRRS